MSLFDAVASSAVNSAASKFIPSSINKQFNAAAKLVKNIQSGNALAIARQGLNIIGDGSAGLAGMAKQAAFWGTETPMFGGLSPMEAKAIHQQSVGVNFAQKNLFLLEVGSMIHGDVSERFNLYASDLEYSPMTISAEKRKVGGATLDSVQSTEPVELTMAVMDDAGGFIKNWFANHVAAASATDGTVGLPALYAIRIKVVHAFVKSTFGAYEDIGLYRASNMAVSLSRKEDALQELTLTFSQLDTFMAP